MSKKKGNFADQYLDKIILGLTGLLGLYLLWAFVLSNPYGQKVGSQKISPSRIDSQNKRQALLIEKKLQDPAETTPYIQDKAAEFLNFLGCAIPKLSITANWPLPGGGRAVSGENPIYVLPQIPPMDIVKLASIRGTVRMPMEDVTPEIPYLMVSSKPADIDLVTISAHVNLQALYNNFRQSFMGPRLKPQWKDPTYAEPVPARIEMQRRVQNADGSWGQWQTVPFTRIDPYQKMFKDMPLTTEEMTYGNVALFMNPCREFAVMKDILQPSSYDFLSSQIKWLPPEYYEEYQKISDEEEARRLREEREQRLREREGGRGNRPGNRTQPPPQPRRGGRGDNQAMEGMGGPGGMGMPMTPRPSRQIRTVQDVERDAAAIVLTDKTRFSALKDMVVWVHDDTVVPGTTYQYRIRYGMFNPVAGKDWVAPESKEYKNQLILWSAYTELPEPVVIPKMLHLFPMDVLADGAGVNVEIYKYYMGQWRTETFEVHFGQMIGKPMESKSQGVFDGGGVMGMDMGINMGGVQQSTLVDYSTGYMLMDVQTTNDWSGIGVRQHSVPWMLCIDNADQILKLAAKKQYWSKEMTAAHASVTSEMLKASGTPSEGMMGPGMEGGMQPGMTTRIRDVGGGL